MSVWEKSPLTTHVQHSQILMAVVQPSVAVIAAVAAANVKFCVSHSPFHTILVQLAKNPATGRRYIHTVGVLPLFVFGHKLPADLNPRADKPSLTIHRVHQPSTNHQLTIDHQLSMNRQVFSHA